MEVQELLNEYNKRQGVIENNEKLLNECIKSLNTFKQGVTPEILDILNKYSPNIMDLLDEEKFGKLENVEEFKKVLEYTINSLCTSIEGILF